MKEYECIRCGEKDNVTIAKVKQKVSVGECEFEAEINVITCNNCGEDVFDRENEIENDKIVFGKYKEIMGLVSIEDIISIRKKYNISAITLAKLLGFGEKTITRYENGAIQDKAHDLMLRFVQIDENMKLAWEKSKDELTQNENDKMARFFAKKSETRRVKDLIENTQNNIEFKSSIQRSYKAVYSSTNNLMSV